MTIESMKSPLYNSVLNSTVKPYKVFNSQDKHTFLILSFSERAASVHMQIYKKNRDNPFK